MKHLFVTHVSFVLSKIPYYTLNYGTVREGISKYPVISLKAVREAIGDIRRSKLPDPKWLGNAGSFFMNPVVGYDTFATIRKEYPQMPFYEISDDRVKIPAAWLIEQCGWKGKVSGATAVYNKQPLILINIGGAK
jgi:UDP-N-acetylmuramate dehydrogenase